MIVSLNLDKISPQVLCFSEHHMSENNLNLLNIENYALGSCFSRCRYQKGGVCIFVHDICFRHVDLLNCCVEKILEICAVCWRGPAAYTKDRPVFSLERAPHKNKTLTVKQ
jgi:hypothetical protein